MDDARRELEQHFEDASNLGQLAEHLVIYHSPAFELKSFFSIPSIRKLYNNRILGVPERTGDLAAVMTHLRQGDILVIESIHRLSQAVCATLVDVMATFTLHIEVGKGPSKKEVTLQLPQFTVIGATSKPSLLSDTLRKAFNRQIKIGEDDDDLLTRPEGVK